MAHDYEESIKCPYCNYEFGDSWEHDGDDGSDLDCPECGKEFTLSVHFDVKYSTERKDCDNEAHNFGEWQSRTIDQKTCDRWNSEKFLRRNDWKPHLSLHRDCNNCEASEHKTEELK